MMSEFEPVLRRQRLEYSLSLPETLRAVCDPDKMARVLDNLLSNACHYAYPASTIAVTGRTDGAWVTITMENAGPTIPPDKLSRMFEAFFRLDAARGSQSGNAGLGLALQRKSSRPTAAPSPLRVPGNRHLHRHAPGAVRKLQDSHKELTGTPKGKRDTKNALFCYDIRSKARYFL